jgi:hypothetical protein
MSVYRKIRKRFSAENAENAEKALVAKDSREHLKFFFAGDQQ